MTENEEYYQDEENIQQTNTKKETDRKCPDCGGTMNFDPATGGLYCPYCEHREEIPPVDEGIEPAMEQDFFAVNDEDAGSFDWGVEKKTVICKSCGAESIYDALQISDVCPYCGSNQVMEEKAVHTIAPGGVCTFKITEQIASQNFIKWIKGKLFCPSKAKKSVKPDSFKGVYLPYWTFDSQTETDYSAKYGIDHTYRDSKGNTHTRTDWYHTYGHYSRFIDDELVCATTRYDSRILNKIEPYDTANNKKYKPEYVAGFVSERYSIGLKDAWERAKEYIKSRLKREIESEVKSDHNADHVKNVDMTITFNDIMYKYLLLPVWISSFKYKNKIYHFMVNGETGKVGGKSPVSAIRVTIFVICLLAVLAGIAYLVYLNQSN